MVIQHKITMDLSTSSRPEQVEVVQDDKYSRDLLISLYAGGVAWTIPAGTTAVVYFEKPDRTGGSYDALPDGAAAASITGNTVRVRLAPQVCTVPGTVRLLVMFVNKDSTLNTFPVSLFVQAKPGLTVTSQNYYKISGSLAESGWTPNKYIGTDAFGNVTTLDAPEFARPTDAQIQQAVAAYLQNNPSEGVTDADIQAAVAAYLTKHPVSGTITDQDVANALDAYFAKNPIQSGATAEQAAQISANTQNIQTNAQSIRTNAQNIQANTDAIATLPITKASDGYTDISGLRRVTKLAVARESDTVINIGMTLQGDVAVSGVLTLDANGLPATYTEDGIDCVFEFTGFDSGEEAG